MRIGVIGGGPAGITAAYELAKKGKIVDVFESDLNVGGMAKSISLWGRRVDLGPHRFFSSDKRINSLWLEVMGKDYEIINRLTRILYGGKFYTYPLKPINALQNLGMFEALRCVLSYSFVKFYPLCQDDSFETWVVNRFGRRLFEVFFKTYSEKLWGISCKDLDSDFAAQRIKKLSLFEAVKSAFFGNAGNKHKTLVDQFAYPIGGTGVVYERMADYVCKHKGSVNYKTPVGGLIMTGDSVTGLYTHDGQRRDYDHVISCMPLTHLVTALGNVPADVSLATKQLKFRNTILVYLHVEGADLFPDQWIYVHSPNLKTGRITNFSNWMSESRKEPTTIIVMEYWCNDDEPLWQADNAELIALAKREIKSIGIKAIRYLGDKEKDLINQNLIKPEFRENLVSRSKNFNLLDGYVYRVPRCYPVYSRGYKNILKPVQDYLRKIKGLTVIGRYGAFKYNNQDHSILMGLLAAENIADGSAHDLWKINTDYDVYQEATAITASGPVSVP